MLENIRGQAVIMRMPQEYQVDISCLSEIRIGTTGRHNIKVLGAGSHGQNWASQTPNPLLAMNTSWNALK